MHKFFKKIPAADKVEVKIDIHKALYRDLKWFAQQHNVALAHLLQAALVEVVKRDPPLYIIPKEDYARKRHTFIETALVAHEINKKYKQSSNS
jgi:hypothetical protein